MLVRVCVYTHGYIENILHKDIYLALFPSPVEVITLLSCAQSQMTQHQQIFHKPLQIICVLEPKYYKKEEI